ncbi:hypothetical protein SI65_09170 [Aspergillus cristatus]|uniref:MACPF domain-containing protein n=1 Tax=Aspergillus cristatus TaxID=573508 RepID=A0A1E3B3Q2_ASPCR|nr:hypothetical protein SI65_09170 [Aspergillus cristatus]
MSLTTTQTDIIEDIFPEDPTTPSLALVASSGAQISLPWSTEGDAMLSFGCCVSQLEGDNTYAPFRTKTAMSEKTLSGRLRFRNEAGAQSSFHKAITSSASSSSEHTSISGKAGVGGKFLRASVSGKYNKDVSDNADDMKASIQATIRTGTVYINEPRFSLEALADTRRTRSNPSYFSERYGDYYVASLQLGADAGVLASSASSAHAESESLDIKVTLTVLWWDIEVNYHSEKHSSSQWSNFNITGFDTLTGSNVTNASLQKPAQEVIQDYIQRVTNLEVRVREKMKEFGLTEDRNVDLDTCRKLCESGLVVEITLLPYSQVRDYVTALNERD